jgi:hypothetical protein
MAAYKKDINLLAVMTQKKSRVGLLAIIIPIIVFLILGASLAFGAFWYGSTVTTLTAERDSLQLYIESSRVTDSQEEAQELKDVAEKMRVYADEIKSALYNLSSYPDLYGEQFELIFELAGDDIVLSEYIYDRRTGTLSFSATSLSVRRMPYFVQSLRENAYFSDVQYRGYVRDTRTETGEAVIDPVTELATAPTIEILEYRYEITCRLATPEPYLPDEGTSSETTDSNQEGSDE